MKNIILAASLIAMSGCIPVKPQPATPEQQAMAEKIRASFLANLNGGQSQAPAVIKAEKTNNELSQLKTAIFNSGSPAQIKKSRNQLVIDSAPYIDREGSIINFNGSDKTGEFTYTIHSGSHEIIKYTRANSQESAIKIATVEKNFNGVTVHTVTGEKYSGQKFTLTSNGFLVSRENTVFKYTIADKENTFSVLPGYHIAAFQNGDVSATNYVLLEKNEDDSSSGGLMSSLKGLGSTLGINKDYGYLLANINNGSVVPVNISTGSKSVANYSNCESNGYINKCKDVTMEESLYEKDGRPNYDHYYWSLNWFMGQTGPVAIYKESSSVKYINLVTNQELELFNRMLGISWMKAEQFKDGSIAVSARLGFSTEEISDVEGHVANNKNLLQIVDVSDI